MILETGNEIFRYTLLYVQLYVQIFLLFSLFEGEEQEKKEGIRPPHDASVTIIVPCYNEEATVARTLESLLALEYPKELLHIICVDDGSRDGTWKALQRFKTHPNITLFQKKNQGSKYHALNFALQHVVTEFVGCLDADSRVEKSTLQEIMWMFRDQPEAMAVIPTMVIDAPKTLLQHMQKVEYEIGTAMRRMFANMNALYITPGPFSIFRREVFTRYGGYAFAHHTEDLELALRLHIHNHKIAYATRALVYTVGPATLRPLLKQRVRWLTGFLRNMIDYRKMLFKPSYRDLGLVVLPYAILSILSFLYFVPVSMVELWNFGVGAWKAYGLQTGPVLLPWDSIGWFYLDTQALNLLMAFLLLSTLLIIFLGRRITKTKMLSLDLFTLLFYPFVASIWSIKSIYDVVFSRHTHWR